MPLPAGKKLGPYELVSLVGAGGMGEVYRARDPRIGRDVALKVLATEFCSDPDRLHRFEKETRAVGMLNHANILAIYDVGTADGIPYLVSELLEGETLRKALEGGPLPIRKAIEYTTQIADGLARAHAKGIIHRDLKPENIYLCKEGGLKILDFGLAKLIQPESTENPTSESPTLSTPTGRRSVMGTPGYMSPEQLRGLPLDGRSDIFNVGVILYEMLSGSRAFKRETYADTVSAILKEDPPELTEADTHIPPQLGNLVRHCLEKNPEERFQSVRDLAFDLKNYTGDSHSHPTITPQQAEGALDLRRPGILPSNLVLQLLSVVGIILIAAGVGWWFAGRMSPASPRKPVRIERLTDFQGLEEYPAVSPDGKSVAFSADTTGTRQIWVRLIAGGPPLQLTHDESDHTAPRWFSDLASILYYTPPGAGEAEGALWEISALGGAPRRMAGSVSEGDVSHDGTKLAFFRLNEGHTELVVTDQNGTNPHVLFKAEKQQKYALPRWSPDDKWVAFENRSVIWAYDVYMVPSGGGEPRQVTHENNVLSGFAWEPDGKGVIYSTGRESTTLYLPRMSLWREGLSGGTTQQLTFDEASYDYPDVDRKGNVFASRRRIHFELWKFPVAGNPSQNVKNGVQLTHQTAQVQTPSPSPDDKDVAFLSDSGGHGNIWVVNLASGEMRQITFDRDPARTIGTPVWSPNGAHLAVALSATSNVGTSAQYEVVNPDGSNPRVVIPNGSWATWSGDSRWLYYTEILPGHFNGDRMFKQPIDGGTPVLVRSDQPMSPAVAWDGSGIYYVVPLQDVSGLLDFEIRYARPETGPSHVLARIQGLRVPEWQGLQPVLSHDGKWLAMPLNDSLGTNLWLMPTVGGKLRQVTDFGKLRTFIARRVSWSADDRFIYAAVGEGDSDIVAMEGLLH